MRCTPQLRSRNQFPLSALQLSLPEWPGRLPTGLTQLVLSPLDATDAERRAGSCSNFIYAHLAPLQRLRHLAFHGLPEIGDRFLQLICWKLPGRSGPAAAG